MERLLSKALTWDELADLYPGTARIKPMEDVFAWAEKQTDRFAVHPDNGTLHLIIQETTDERHGDNTED